MDSKNLYFYLEKDFVKAKIIDDWSQEIPSIKKYLTPNYKKRFIGLMCDNTKIVKKVYTAVFLSNDVLNFILNKKENNVLLFVHHPATWNICNKDAFILPDKKLLNKCIKKQISIFNFHAPLDNYSKYSTSVTLAKALGLKIIKKFALHKGAYCGVISECNFKKVKDLQKHFTKILGHKTKLCFYGNPSINSKKIAIVAGGGNDRDILKQVLKQNINTFLTGITAKNSYSQEAHQFAKENKINILGGTHYSTEKFACIAMCQYFEKLKIPSEFIEEKPLLEDL